MFYIFQVNFVGKHASQSTKPAKCKNKVSVWSMLWWSNILLWRCRSMLSIWFKFRSSAGGISQALYSRNRQWLTLLKGHVCKVSLYQDTSVLPRKRELWRENQWQPRPTMFMCSYMQFVRLANLVRAKGIVQFLE